MITSRIADAFTLLHDWWERTRQPGLHRTALLALAVLKRDTSIDFLISLIATAEGPTARDAIAALGLYRHDTVLVDRVRTAAACNDVDLAAAIRDTFD